IFLGLASERQCEEDYLDPMVKLLPRDRRGPPQKIARMCKDRREKDGATSKKDDPSWETVLTSHDIFVVRCAIHALALFSLEFRPEVTQRFTNLQVPQLLCDLFYSEQIDRSSGEAVLLFFAHVLRSTTEAQALVIKAFMSCLWCSHAGR
ncbi:MAG: hypothetical protein ACKPKO_59285, partial [Candidatus Fonsibacter sp.]